MMDSARLATASLNDIIFDGRNQAYGAYALRQSYGRNVMKALTTGMLLLLLLVLTPLIAKRLEKPTPPKELNLGQVKFEDVVVDPRPVQPPPPPPPAEPAPPPRAATIRFTPPVVARENEVRTENEVPEQEDLTGKTVSTVTVAGREDAPTDLIELEDGQGKDIVDEVVPDKIHTWVEQMPSLPGGGGLAGIVAAIQKAVRYPAVDLRDQTEGKVFASFTVDQNGEITDVKMVKGLSGTIDAETIRAIKTLPRFIPGKQNGRAVKVSFTVPVTYKIQ